MNVDGGYLCTRERVSRGGNENESEKQHLSILCPVSYVKHVYIHI